MHALLVLFAATTPTLRLPTEVRPTKYNVELTIDPTQEQFTGKADIELQVTKPVDVLWLNATDLKITYEKVAAKGDDVVFTNVKLMAGRDNTVMMPSLVVSGITERPGGGFSAKRMTFDGGSAHATEGESKWATALLEDVVVPSAMEVSAHAKLRPFRKLTLATVALSQSAKGVPITVPTVTVDIGAPMSFAANADYTASATALRDRVAAMWENV